MKFENLRWRAALSAAASPGLAPTGAAEPLAAEAAAPLALGVEGGVGGGEGFGDGGPFGGARSGLGGTGGCFVGARILVPLVLRACWRSRAARSRCARRAARSST